ncbi:MULTISPECIES: TonB-dependent receptor [Bradyrhizobium]|uniref:TonB-dependent receptor family protein n=1 Tax=Bradyrhizobium TaxID=374 RepID=UPI00047F8B67|nr:MULTISPECIES: TonB-dependent receptor [Bradyrhizobium]KQT13225.1 ligand-gated channel [Bradyrhizobium sp. Leaf396]
MIQAIRWIGRQLPLRTMALAALLSSASQACFAQSATPGSAITLDPIVVETRQPQRSVVRQQRSATRRVPTAAVTPSPATPSVQPAGVVRQRFDMLPGGVALMTQQDIADHGNPSLANSLSGIPGLIVQNFLGANDQPRIQMRGAAQQNPAERGVLVLQNGLPINRADGSFIIGFASPQQADSIEVYRGYMANRLGATVLSGAINFVSPTGSSQPGTQIGVSGGSFGQINTSGQVGGRKDDVDAFFQFETSRRDGFRDYNSSERVGVNGNLGVALSENVKTRFFMSYTDLGFDVAGPLNRAALYANPRQTAAGPTVVGGVAINPGPNAVRDKPRREASQFMVGNRTTAVIDAHLFDLALGYTYTDDMFRFPISSGVRATQGGDFTGVARYAYNPTAALLPLFETTAQYTVGSADRFYALNQSGQTSAQFGANLLNAQTLSLYAGANVPVWRQFVVSPSISYAYATRDNDDIYGSARRPTIAYNPANPTALLPNGSVATQDTSYSRRYAGWSPSLAISYRPDAVQTFFVAGSHSFEPPTHDDLIATLNGTPNSSAGRPSPGNPALAAAAFATPNLRAQTANTAEGGWRGRTDRFSWDAVTYYSWVGNELLTLRDVTGAPLAAVNADRTTHFGVELGTGMKFTDRLSGRLAYTYQDFRFVRDSVRGNNRLGGVVPHLIYAQVQLQATDAWMVQGAVRWSPTKVAVDNMNTLYADPYAVVDLRTEYKIDKTFWVFGEITNLFNKTYAATALVVDRATSDQAAFLPADGRGFYAGIKAKF